MIAEAAWENCDLMTKLEPVAEETMPLVTSKFEEPNPLIVTTSPAFTCLPPAGE